MRIVQVIHDFLLTCRAGSELYTYYLSKELSKNHDLLLFFAISEDKKTGEVLKGHYDGLPYWALRKQYRSYSHYFHYRNRWVEEKFGEILEHFKPDLIHFQHLIDLSLSLPSVAERRGIPSCLTLHDFWYLCPRTILLTSNLEICTTHSPKKCLACLQGEIEYYNTQGEVRGLWRTTKREVKRLLNFRKKTIAFLNLALWRTCWIKKIFRDVNIFIAPSQFILEKYVQSGLAREKVVFIKHGINKYSLNEIKRTASPKVRFGFIGSIGVHKGIYLLIDAFNKITGDAELKIYGGISPSVENELKKRIGNLDIHIMGELNEEDKGKAFSEIDVLVVPSLCYENNPLTINEAFLAKVPVITADIGGMAELVKDGEYGFTFPVGEVEKLAEKIQLFINNPELRDTLSSNLPEVKDIETNSEEILTIYRRLLKSQSDV